MSTWEQLQAVGPQSYICGYCGNNVSSKEGYHTSDGNRLNYPIIVICPGCNCPSYFRSEPSGGGANRVFQTPAPMLGNEVEALPIEILTIYKEARQCTSAEAYTASIMACRKILMHVAVQKGAKEGKSFVDYVEYLSTNHYVPPDSKIWVDHIRQKGNEANHEIVIMSQADALELLSFVEMLLKFIYEFPARILSKPSL